MTVQSEIGFIKQRANLMVAGLGTGLTVHWVTHTGGTVDAGTGAQVGGVVELHSGILMAFGKVEPATSVERRFAEIQTGDLILDVGAEAMIRLPDGTETPLSGVEPHGLRVVWDGREFTQAKVGEELLRSWDVTHAGIRTMRTILMRPAT